MSETILLKNQNYFFTMMMASTHLSGYRTKYFPHILAVQPANNICKDEQDMVGLDDLGSLFQPCWVYDSIYQPFLHPEFLLPKACTRKQQWRDNPQEIKSSSGNRKYLQVQSLKENSNLELWYNTNRCRSSQKTCMLLTECYETKQTVRLWMSWKTEDLFDSRKLHIRIYHFLWTCLFLLS